MDNPFTHNPLKNLSKTQRNIAIGGAAVIGGVLVVKHHSSTGSWNPWSIATKGSNDSANAIDPVTGMAFSQDNAVDPITGQAYLAEAEQYGSVQAAESAVSSFGTSTSTGSGIGVSPASPQPSGSSTTVGSAYTSNAAWAQAATAGLADIGYPETDVATALGDYLTATPVTSVQAGYIRTALAEFDNPPIGTFQIILAPEKKPGAGQSTVPPVIGAELVNAQRDIADAGLKSTARGPAFTAGKGTRIVVNQAPQPQTKVTSNSTVILTYEIQGAPKQGKG